MNRRTFGSRLVASPYLLWMVLFIIVPLLMVVYYAFTDKTGAFTTEHIFALSRYGQTLGISVLYAFIATAICLIISFPFAYFMARSAKNWQRVMMLLVMLPMWMNFLIRIYSWITILSNTGIINTLLGKLGLGPVQLINTPGAVILGMVYNFIPYMILPIYSVMCKIDRPLLEAADDLGSGAWMKLKRIILPISVPGIVSGVTMVFVPAVSTFYISQKLGGGKTLLIGDAIEAQFMNTGNYNLGASLSLVLMVMILISMFFMNRFADEDGGVLI